MTSQTPHDRGPESGAALTTALLVMLLMAAATAGFTALVITDTRVRTLDNSRTASFYAVAAGLEKLTSDLGDLFAVNVGPTGAQVNALMGTPPAVGVTWTQPDGTNGYSITFPADGAGNPTASVMTVQSGPFEGLVGLATPYTMTATGHIADGSEVSLTRTLQTIAIPVFQFGIFSENDLSFFAGPNFNFGGRVHTNSNLFLAEGDGNALTLADKVTSVGEIVRKNLSNGWSTATNYNGTVSAITAPGAFRNLSFTEGSLVGTIGSARNEPTWTNLSTGTYNHNIKTGNTGAKRLDLPITQFGAQPIDLIKRPVVNENITAPNVLAERFYFISSLRILLSDTAADITNLPGIDNATAPKALGIVLPVAAVGDATPNLAQSAGPQVAASDPTILGVNGQTYGSRTIAGAPLLGGFIKIEMCNQNVAPVGTPVPAPACRWQDVTTEILNLGYAMAQQPDPATGAPAGCTDPSPNAVIRIQRYRDMTACWNTNAAVNGGNIGGANTPNRRDGKNFSPLVLYDPREASLRDTAPTAMQFGGVMHYIALDARNLSRWFQGTIGATGINASNANGYTVYFSDRRGNRNAAGAPVETGEYGFEDVVNPATAGVPDNVQQVGEEFNAVTGQPTVLDVYGETPRFQVQAAASVPTLVAANWRYPLCPVAAPFPAAVAGMATMPACTAGLAARPWTTIDPSNVVPTVQEEIAVATRNPAIFFRRALKLINGGGANIGVPLTVASENPVYIQGNWNAENPVGNGFAGAHRATAVLADSVTLLSNNWSDRNGFLNALTLNPNAAAGVLGRPATTTWYRVAIISGKGPAFPQPAGTAQDFGTDGGAHNFLRYIEDWGAQAATLNYRGSIASLYFSRQATATYKCCTMVYSPPTRGYNFDVDFLTPALLPPRTPMFRDVNVTGFSQIIRPN